MLERPFHRQATEVQRHKAARASALPRGTQLASEGPDKGQAGRGLSVANALAVREAGALSPSCSGLPAPSCLSPQAGEPGEFPLFLDSALAPGRSPFS